MNIGAKNSHGHLDVLFTVKHFLRARHAFTIRLSILTSSSDFVAVLNSSAQATNLSPMTQQLPSYQVTKVTARCPSFAISSLWDLKNETKFCCIKRLIIPP